jgi:hypothetical protein
MFCAHGKQKRNCLVCSGCPHGKQKGNCVVCSGCPHGKVKYSCVECNPCPHGKRKTNCVVCSGCPHGKQKSTCVECNPCPHGKQKLNCVVCSGCPHGKLKRNCVVCTPRPHTTFLFEALNKIEGTLGLVELMKKKETEKFADPKPHMYFPPRGTPVVDQSVLNPKLTEFEVEYCKALKVMLLDKDGEIKNPAIPMWELGKHTCEVYNGPCMVCLGLFVCIK